MADKQLSPSGFRLVLQQPSSCSYLMCAYSELVRPLDVGAYHDIDKHWVPQSLYNLIKNNHLLEQD